MSPKYWEAFADLSNDSSAESTHAGSRDVSSGAVRQREPSKSMESNEVVEEVAMKKDSNVQDTNAGPLSRAMASDFQLPSLQPHQHASLFYLSLIEGRCRTQAMATINAERLPQDYLAEDHSEVTELAAHLFAEMSKELVKAGMIPEEFVGRPLPELRLYLNSFDAILDTIATKKAQDLSQSFTLPSNNSINHISASLDSSTSTFGPLQALIRRPDQQLNMAPTDHLSLLGFSQSPLYANMPFSMQSTGVPTSIYAKEYTQVAVLGKGGFGRVYKARFYLDSAEYAIKRIIIKGSRVQRLVEKGKWKTLWAEVEALSKLHHRHVVRYHHCWLETRQAIASSSTSDEDEDDESASSICQNTRHNTQVEALTSGVESFRIGVEKELHKEMRRLRRNSTTHEVSPEMIVFEEESSSTRTEKLEKHGFFRSANEPDSDDSDGDNNQDSGSTIDLPLVTMADTPKVDRDFILYIKMAAYPLSLLDYISPSSKQLGTPVKHCFHLLPTVRLLQAILSGVEYLHRKDIIHRDLKPGNIFLDILEESEPETDGYVNTRNCKECSHTAPVPTIRLSPCIGDFGLIADLKDLKSSADSPNPSVAGSFSNTSQLSTPTSQRLVGTTLYVPPVTTHMKAKPVVCPKLDVYSLGIIAFEMIHRFNTGAERGQVLMALRDRSSLPEGYEDHPMAEGIKSMLCKERENRWDCETVREWLSDLEKRFA